MTTRGMESMQNALLARAIQVTVLMEFLPFQLGIDLTLHFSRFVKKEVKWAVKLNVICNHFMKRCSWLPNGTWIHSDNLNIRRQWKIFAYLFGTIIDLADTTPSSPV
jgi:hypothetical protein